MKYISESGPEECKYLKYSQTDLSKSRGLKE